MIKNKKLIYILLLVMMIPLLTGCVRVLRDDDNNVVRNPETGQNLTSNIMCRPTDPEIIKKYQENGVDIEELPACTDLTIGGEYVGIWFNIFIKPLAVGIVQLGSVVGNIGLSVILLGLIIRIIAMPITKKIAIQSENTKRAKPELNKLEKKFKGKTDQASILKKNQEMSAIYKKYNINPVVGCLFAAIQLPIFLAFFEAINRVPIIFESSLLTLQLGTTPLHGIQNGNFIYLLLIVLLVVTTYYSFNFSQKDMAIATPGPMNSKMMIYGLLIFITIAGVNLPTAILLYWITSSGFTIGQNLYLQKTRKADELTTEIKEVKVKKKETEPEQKTSTKKNKNTSKKGGKK